MLNYAVKLLGSKVVFVIEWQLYAFNGLVNGQALVRRAHRLVPNKLNRIAITQNRRFNLNTA